MHNSPVMHTSKTVHHIQRRILVNLQGFEVKTLFVVNYCVHVNYSLPLPEEA